MDECQSRRQSKHDLHLFYYGAILFLLAQTSASAAFLIGFFCIPVSVYAFLRRIHSSFVRGLGLRIIAYGGCALLFGAGPGGCAFNTYRTEAAMDPIILALDQYHHRHGRYPDDLKTIGAALSLSCPNQHWPMLYTALDAASHYRLTCYTFVFNKHTYKSENKEWIDWD